jgi:hypothetical protein
MGPLFNEKDDILSLQSKAYFKVKAKPLLTQASKMKQSLITSYFQRAQEQITYPINIFYSKAKTKPSDLST